MDNLSDLNKRERDVRGSIASLTRQFRNKEISRKEFDKAVKARNRELLEISEDKGKLIGETLPPLPPPPRPPDREDKGSGLDAIKKSILEGRGIEPPGPPVIMKIKQSSKPKVMKEIPIKKPKLSIIKKPPVAKKPPAMKKPPSPPAKAPPAIKKPEFPAMKQPEPPFREPPFKEPVKEPPPVKPEPAPMKQPEPPAIGGIEKPKFAFIKRPETPAIGQAKAPPGSDVSRKLEENATELRNIRVDITRNEQELSQFLKEVREAAQRIEKLEAVRSDVKALKSRIDKIDFQGLTQEIYNQFDKMNSRIKESEKKTDDLVERMNVELKTLKESVGEASQAKEHVETLDVSNMRRDMESLKQKSQYIEQHLENVDMRPIVEMIREVENKVNSLKASSALIIE